jgi:hypothetical protein
MPTSNDRIEHLTVNWTLEVVVLAVADVDTATAEA